MALVETQNLVKHYKKHVALNGITLSIEKGEIFGLVGPNGAGKSTLVSVLTTLSRPDSGTARVVGFDVQKQGKQVRRNIAIVFQDCIVDDDLSGYENIDVYGALYNVPPAVRETQINELATIVGLKDKLDQKAELYSGGMKRELELIRGFVHHPALLFLDEPTLGLDPKARQQIYAHIRKLNSTYGTTIFFTTNYLDEAEVLATRVGIINKGELIAVGTPDQLKSAVESDSVELVVDTVSMELLDAFRGLPWVKNAGSAGLKVVLHVVHAEVHVEEIIQIAHRYTRKIQSILLKKPTLNDVFLHYAGEVLR